MMEKYVDFSANSYITGYWAYMWRHQMIHSSYTWTFLFLFKSWAELGLWIRQLQVGRISRKSHQSTQRFTSSEQNDQGKNISIYILLPGLNRGKCCLSWMRWFKLSYIVHELTHSPCQRHLCQKIKIQNCYLERQNISDKVSMKQRVEFCWLFLISLFEILMSLTCWFDLLKPTPSCVIF